uniref:Uncharacterized protein n=2 Tax=Viruses TaxID=10239 RepID=A0A8S5Q2L2_9CAUD|nr:MAG TPA: hypothetical protein [Siphoviridae sp. ctVif31]DAE27948.1 MAG TPA: hypothetical protein [virus sp. ctDYl1]DAF17503.1 MAG TPA: hypothetical protein [Caudoviricetes sp.]DAT84222.1 MAG TPA: hypothetical protein [Bacteriophage sp.]DAH46393.1 MAG TPA: hypothetical protein [Caudoviricetes sp.]
MSLKSPFFQSNTLFQHGSLRTWSVPDLRSRAVAIYLILGIKKEALDFSKTP